MTFASGWLPAPAGVPATSINNFSIFVNGQLIELAAIVSFTESGGVTTLVINETELGFGFDSMDEVIAIGKFTNITPTPPTPPTPSGAFSSAFSNAFS
jgi:hypothetical protein